MEFAELLSGLIVVASGVVTTLAVTILRKASTWVDGLPKEAKQAIVLVIAFGVTKLNGLFGLALPVDALAWQADVVNTLITAGLAFGVYNILPKAK